MICKKFIKVGDYDYLGNVRQLWRTSGKLVDSNFSDFFFFNTRKQAPHKIESHLLLSLLRKAAHLWPDKWLQHFQTVSATQDRRLDLLLCHCSLPWAFVCTLALPPFLSFAEPQNGCSDLQFALENFQSGRGRYFAHVVPPAGGSGANLQVSSLQHSVGQRATWR